MFKNRCKPKPRKTNKPGKPKRRAPGEDENADPETEAQDLQPSEEEKDTAPSENSEEPQAEPDEQETSKTDEDSKEETPSDDANPSSTDEADSDEETPAAESEPETEPEQDVTAEIAKLQTDLENAQKALADKEAELASLQAVEQTGKVLSSEGLPRELAQYLPSDPERLGEVVELLKSLKARPGGERIPRPDSVKGERGGKDYEAFFASLD